MGWFTRKRDSATALSTKSISSSWTGSNGETALDRKTAEIAKEYHRNLYLWACINQIVTTAAVPPFYISTENDRALTEEERAVLTLLDRPNPQWSRPHLVEFTSLCLATTMRAFIHVVRGVGNRPLELWPLDPTHMSIVYEEGTPIIKEFVYQSGTNKIKYPVAEDGTSDIIYIHRANMDPQRPAISPAAVAVPPAEFFNRILQKGADIAGNSSNVTGILSTETEVDQSGVEKIRDRLDDFKTGNRRSGDTLVVANAQWKFERLTEDPTMVLSVEIKDSLARDVCAVMGMPTQLVSIPGSQTYANYETARASFITETIIPMYLGPLVSELTRALLRPPISSRRLRSAQALASIAFDMDAWPAMVKARLSLVEVASKASFLTTNEKRELLGYPKSDLDAADLIPDLEKLDLERLKIELSSSDPAADISAGT